ncbi:MAG: FolM Alternative dihydrofolate reductase 1, partial [uncultured Acetobacteraceae bacterium]
AAARRSHTRRGPARGARHRRRQAARPGDLPRVGGGGLRRGAALREQRRRGRRSGGGDPRPRPPGGGAARGPGAGSGGFGAAAGRRGGARTARGRPGEQRQHLRARRVGRRDARELGPAPGAQSPRALRVDPGLRAGAARRGRGRGGEHAGPAGLVTHAALPVLHALQDGIVVADAAIRLGAGAAAHPGERHRPRPRPAERAAERRAVRPAVRVRAARARHRPGGGGARGARHPRDAGDDGADDRARRRPAPAMVAGLGGRRAARM